MTVKNYVNSNFNRIENDFYQTPVWATQAIYKCLTEDFRLSSNETILEPCAGLGAISNELKRLGLKNVATNDLIDRDGFKCDTNEDFLKMDGDYDVIITNPPFANLAEEFVNKALEMTQHRKGKVAMLLRANWEYSIKRTYLFTRANYAGRLLLTTRPKWFDDEIVKNTPVVDSSGNIVYKDNGEIKYQTPKQPMHNYCWYIWDWGSASQWKYKYDSRISKKQIEYYEL